MKIVINLIYSVSSFVNKLEFRAFGLFDHADKGTITSEMFSLQTAWHKVKRTQKQRHNSREYCWVIFLLLSRWGVKLKFQKVYDDLVKSLLELFQEVAVNNFYREGVVKNPQNQKLPRLEKQAVRSCSYHKPTTPSKLNSKSSLHTKKYQNNTPNTIHINTNVSPSSPTPNYNLEKYIHIPITLRSINILKNITLYYRHKTLISIPPSEKVHLTSFRCGHPSVLLSY